MLENSARLWSLKEGKRTRSVLWSPRTSAWRRFSDYTVGGGGTAEEADGVGKAETSVSVGQRPERREGSRGWASGSWRGVLLRNKPCIHRVKPREAGQELPRGWPSPRARVERSWLITGHSIETETPERPCLRTKWGKINPRIKVMLKPS